MHYEHIVQSHHDDDQEQKIRNKRTHMFYTSMQCLFTNFHPYPHGYGGHIVTCALLMYILNYNLGHVGPINQYGCSCTISY